MTRVVRGGGAPPQFEGAPKKDNARILVVIRHPVGGIRTYMQYVFGHGDFSAFDIDFLLPEGGETDVLEDKLSLPNVSYLRTRDSTSSLALATLTRANSNRYDLVHAHGFTAAVCSSFALRARISRLPLLITPHDVILKGQFSGAGGWTKRTSLYWALKHARHIILVSRAARENMLNVYRSAARFGHKLEVIPTGIDVGRFFDVQPADLHEKLELPSDTFLIGFFGRFMAQKDFRNLVEAVAVLSQRNLDRRFVVVSVGGGGYRDREQRAIEARGLLGYFRFVDFAPDIGAYLKAVNVVAMPSRWETGPLLPKEALVAGVPIITSDEPACAEIAAQSPMITVPVGDADALARALLAEMQDPSTKVFRDFSRTARAEFDSRLTAKRVLATYQSIIGVGLGK